MWFYNMCLYMFIYVIVVICQRRPIQFLFFPPFLFVLFDSGKDIFTITLVYSGLWERFLRITLAMNNSNSLEIVICFDYNQELKTGIST